MLADDGCRLWTTEVGRGTPLIVCHGGPGLWDMFGDLADLVADRVRVIRWDQRGCGRSERRGPYSLAGAVSDLDAVRRHVGVDRVAVLGHSWGAQLALRYALDHPDRVTALAYVSGTGLGFAWHPHYERALAKRLEGRPEPGEVDERDRAIGAELRATWREAEPVAACRALPTPTLIIDGTEDIRPRWAVDSLAAALPTVTRVALAGAGHLPWLEAPDEFRTALIEAIAAA